MNYGFRMEVINEKRPLESEDRGDLRLSKLSKISSYIEKIDLNLSPTENPNFPFVHHITGADSPEPPETLPDLTLSLTNGSNNYFCSHRVSNPNHYPIPELTLSLSIQSEDVTELDSLIPSLNRDISINCLSRCSRSDYGLIASLNRSFRSLIQSGELYKLRRQNNVVEHWVYFSCHLLEWEAFDPISFRWMRLPRMPLNDCFMCSDKESLAVGTELLVFGKEVTAHVIYRYSILTNSWSRGMKMNAPRCLFGSASLGEKAILAGGCDSQGNILRSAELYNSESGTWEILPNMNKARKMCSAVFMDGKFYVIGGTGGSESKPLACGEEFDLETKAWTEIPDMSPGRGGVGIETPCSVEAPPLIAVVNNELYAADYVEKKVRKYDKNTMEWATVGDLPERLATTKGWGLAFRSCGEGLIVIGGLGSLGEGIVELNGWVPSENPAKWNLLARKCSGNFVYNCAVMGC